MGTDIVKAEAVTPDAGELLHVANGFRSTAMAFEIDSLPMYEMAADELKKIKKLKKDRIEQRMGITRKFDEAKQSVMNLFKPGIKILDEAIDLLELNMLEFTDEQKRIREKAERVAREAQEKARQEAEEKARQEAETARKAEEEARRATAEAKNKKDRETAAIKEAEAKAAREKAAAAQTVADVVEHAPPPAVNHVKPKGTRETWSFEVTDFNQLPDEYKLENTKMLNGMATSTKGKVDVPGVRFFTKTGIVSR